jgi:uncharacterized membrane protein HdeD (DUF308 family)
MPSARALALIERWAWILIYGGLFAVVLGVASRESSPATAWTLGTLGTAFVIGGIVLIWLRSRIRQDK